MEIRKHPTGPVPKWGLYFYWGRGITRVVITAPFIRLTLMPVTESSETPTCFRTRLSVAWRVYEEAPHSRGCSHNPFFLRKFKAKSSISHLFSLNRLLLI